MTIWSDPDRGLELRADHRPSQAFVERIASTRFGGQGLRYRRLGVAAQLSGEPALVCVSLLHSGTVVGAYALKPVTLELGTERLSAVYRSSLGVATAQQGRGLGKQIVAQTLAWLTAQAQQAGIELLSYGCIEQGNTPSSTLLKSMGSHHVGSLHTQMMYRQWPRRRLQTIGIDANEDARVEVAQRDMADAGSLRFAQPERRRFTAVVDGDNLVAGACVSKVAIDFDRIGQPWDFLSRHVFSKVGPARRRFDPHHFTYLKLDGVVATESHAARWPDLVTTLMHEHRTHMAMFALDPRSAVCRRLHRAGVFGRVARATRQQLDVYAMMHGSSESDQSRWLSAMRAAPLAIGPLA